MRNLLAVLFAVGLVVSPSFAVSTYKYVLDADGSTFDGTNNVLNVTPGQTITVKILAGADTTGISSMSGYVRALTGSTANTLTTTPNSWQWDAQFPGYEHWDIDPQTGEPYRDIDFRNVNLGTAGANGSWGSGNSSAYMASVRLDPNRNPWNVGILPDLQLVATYEIKVNPTATTGNTVTLAWRHFVPGVIDIDPPPFTTLYTNLVITVPEPASMALLALGGLLLARRRHA